MLGDLVETRNARMAEYSRRKKLYQEATFSNADAIELQKKGWTLIRENKDTVRLQRPRDFREQLENEFWRLLYDFGYTTLNRGNNFRINVSAKGSPDASRDVSVFAFDDQTIIVAQCRATEKRSRRFLSKDLSEISKYQKPIAVTLNNYFKDNYKRKIIWLIVTKNIEWKDEDRLLAKDSNIKIITEKELPYFKEIAKRIGKSARYQFHAEFLSRSKTDSLDKTIFAMRARLGKFRVYSFFAHPEAILPISFVNHRDLRDPGSAPSYQRLIQKERLGQIAEFVHNGGLFPNSIILNFKCNARFDIIAPECDGVTPGRLTLPNTYKSAWIIDGQHRLYGYAELESKRQNDLLPFIAFENIQSIDETRLFSEINSKQKRVEKRLLDELNGEIKLESTNKREQIRAIASRVFDLMRDDDESPLGGKISGAQLKHSSRSEITIPYLVDAVVRAGLLGSFIRKEGKDIYQDGFLFWNRPQSGIDSLREFLCNYLDIFRYANEERWERGASGKVASNPGLSGLIRFSEDVLIYIINNHNINITKLHPKAIVEEIEKVVFPIINFLRVSSDDEISLRFSVPYGSSGPARIQHMLRVLMREGHKGFNPAGFEERLRQNDAARIDKADKLVRRIQESVHGNIVLKLKEIYGDGDDFLEMATENQEILKGAYQKRLDDKPENRKGIATYLDFLDLKKIISSEKNWQYFKDKFDYILPEDKKQSKNVGWFEAINKARRIPAHPYDRTYTDDDMRNIENIFQMLTDRGVING